MAFSLSSPSVLLEVLLIPESTGLLVDDITDDVRDGVCFQDGSESCCCNKTVAF